MRRIRLSLTILGCRREKDSSLQDLENRYGKSIERIALLEEELVNKAQLEEEVQRLKDELRGGTSQPRLTRRPLSSTPCRPTRGAISHPITGHHFLCSPSHTTERHLSACSLECLIISFSSRSRRGCLCYSSQAYCRRLTSTFHRTGQPYTPANAIPSCAEAAAILASSTFATLPCFSVFALSTSRIYSR